MIIDHHSSLEVTIAHSGGIDEINPGCFLTQNASRVVGSGHTWDKNRASSVSGDRQCAR